MFSLLQSAADAAGERARERGSENGKDLGGAFCNFLLLYSYTPLRPSQCVCVHHFSEDVKTDRLIKVEHQNIRRERESV